MNNGKEIMDCKIKFLKSGMLTTIQDLGRKNLQHIGISKGGASCSSLLQMANSLVENKEEWGFEFIYNGPQIEIIEGNITIAITGRVNFKLIRDGNEEMGQCFRSYLCKQGDQIIISNTIDSIYGYISFGGDPKINKVFNSLSCNPRSKIGPRDGVKVKDEDEFVINCSNLNEFKFERSIEKQNKNKIRLLEGPQFDFFEKHSIDEFFNTPYEITTTSDKMGMRLKGHQIQNQKTANIKSEAIIKGAIQVPADGQPIILLTDHQTIGGYPKIAVVASADYEDLVQLPPRSKINFKKINLREAKISLELKQKTLENILESKIKV
jgi:biotin-dependent carboxylase-like uncharacterized protein